MKKYTNLNKYFYVIAFLVSTFAASVHAMAVTGEQTMNFDNTIENPLFFVNSAGNTFPFTITGGGSTVPDVGENLLQNGIRTGVIGIGSVEPFDNLGSGHLHYKSGSGGTIGVAFESDSGGAWIDAGGDSFAFKNIYFGAMSHDVNVTGLMSNGSDFSAVIANTSQSSTVDLLNLDARFGDVTLIEMWFDESGRGGVGPLGGTSTYDNIVIGSPVPVPAAVYLFISGLIGLLGVNSQRAGRS